MTAAAAERQGRSPLAWLRRRDRGLRATTRAARTAIVAPAVLAVAVRFHDAQLATFAAFGSIGLLLFFDPPGGVGQRLRSYVTLAVAGAISIVLGTVCARTTVSAVAGMALVAFAVLMLASLGSYAAGATTALLLTFILPVSLPVPWGELAARLEGWGLAVAVAVPVGLLLWPPPSTDPLRVAAARACRQVGRLLQAAGRLERGEGEAAEAAQEATAALEERFRSAAARPGGNGEADRALAVLVEELDFAASVASDVAAADASRHPCRGEIRDTIAVTGDLLITCGDVLENVQTGPAGGQQDAQVQQGLAALASARSRAGDATLARLGDDDRLGQDGQTLVTARDLSFSARALGFTVQSIAEHVLRVRDGTGWQGPASWQVWRRTAWFEIRKRLRPGSPVLHGSVRGAVALAVAVLLARELSLQRGFWVILGTLSVLRSTALGTGASALRAVVGTTLGVLVGAGLLVGIGTNPDVLWALLPIVLFAAGVTPAVVGFLTGQAAFTVVIVILFNILAPSGWRVGLVRIEDVALGVAVSVVVGVLFWPRGVVSAFGAALDEAYVAGADRLRRTVQMLTGDERASPEAARQRYGIARGRLDDAFRMFLVEQGTRQVPLADAATLAAGSTRLRLVADSLTELVSEGMGTGDARGVPEARLREAAAIVDLWYREAGDALAGRRPDVPSPEGPGPGWPGMLLDGLVDGLNRNTDGDDDGDDDKDDDKDDGSQSRPGRKRALMVVWTAQHLDGVMSREPELAASAAVLTSARARARWI